VLALSDTTSLKATFGSAYRVPTLSDLYWYSFDGSDSYGDTYYSYGNPSLKPETSYSGEMGLALAGKRVSVEASVFGRLVYDQINWGNYSSTVSQPSVFIETPVNISESLLPGAEVHATANLTDQISLEANYAFIYSLLLQYLGQSYSASDDLRVPFVPLHNLSLSGRYKNGMHSLSLEVQYVSNKFIDAANTVSTELPGYFVVNAGYRITATENMTFSIELRNILNTLYYAQLGYPMPPFSVETGAQLHM
jgi:outer membrane receptor protein involved in Fe transport